MTTTWKCPLCGIEIPWEPIWYCDRVSYHKSKHFPEAVANARRLGALEEEAGSGDLELGHDGEMWILWSSRRIVGSTFNQVLDALADAQEAGDG